MNDTQPANEQMRSVRRQTLAILDDLVKKGQQYELPAPPAALETYRLKLLDNTYQVLVAGEKKHGKSSFINALIGRDLLPTNVDIATCEVFRVHRAPRAGYRLRFEDGTSQEIAATELATYGSQVMKDLGQTPNLSQIVRWIEADVPDAEFLPPGVNLLDTPGLGSLYAAHGQITQRFVPQADAVIFVLDAEKPALEEELEFVEKILDVTDKIFFVLTKIDLRYEEEWQDIQERDEQLLKARFQDRLGDIHVWPFSSVNLQQAAQTHDDAFLEVSYYDQLNKALQAFLFRVAGRNRCNDALLIADHYQSLSEKILLGRTANLTETSARKAAQLQQEAQQRRQDFETDWGTHGTRSQSVLAEIRKTASEYKRNFVSLVESNGQLERTYRSRIDALKTPEEVQAFGDPLDETVITEVLNQWRSTCNQAYHECGQLLIPILDAADALLPQPDVDNPDLVPQMSANDIKRDTLGQIKEANTGLRTGIQVSAGVVLTAGWIVGAFFPPAVLPIYVVGIPAVLAVGAWSALKGWRGVQDKQLQEARKNLHNHLSDVLHEVRVRFLQADMVGDLSLVNHYFTILVDTMTKQVQEIAETRVQQAKVENNRLAEERQLDEQQRKARAEQLQRQIDDWKALANSIAGCMAALKSLDRS